MSQLDSNSVSQTAKKEPETAGFIEDGRAEPAFSDRGRELELLTENLPGGVHQCLNDSVLTLVAMSKSFLSMFGYTRQEIRERFHNHFAEMIYPEDRENVMKKIRDQLAEGDLVELEYRVVCRDKTVLWILDKGRLALLPEGRQVFHCMLIDITQQRQEREALRLSLERFRIIMDQTVDIIFEWDIAKDTMLYSANWEKKFGYPPIREEVSKRIPQSANIHPADMSSFVKIMEDSAAGVPYSETELRLRDSLGNYRWCRIRATVQYDSGRIPVKVVGVIRDIDVDRRQKEKLMEQVERDSLTGLLNKAAAQKRVEGLLRLQRQAWGVLFIIDLDDFKQINDRYGHLCGDTALIDAAGELKRLFCATDVVSRVGGDEFLACLPGIPPEKAREKAREVIDAMRRITIYGQADQVSCSVGGAIFPEDGADFSSLYRCADLALYHVKKTGKNGMAFYDPSMYLEEAENCLTHFAVNAVIDSDSHLDRNEEMVTEQLGQYCFRMLYQAIELETAVSQILEIVGQAYDVSRVYIFESTEDGCRCSNTFEWCNRGVTSEMARLQNLSYQEDLGDYIENFDENGVFYCRDIRELKPELYKVLAPQGIFSILQCEISEDGQFRGYVGFDECRANRHWTQGQIETLTLVANVLSTFLLKLRLKERLERATEKLKRYEKGENHDAGGCLHEEPGGI